MNTLPLQKRVQILSMSCEGSSMQSISRVVGGLSINTVLELLVEGAEAKPGKRGSYKNYGVT